MKKLRHLKFKLGKEYEEELKHQDRETRGENKGESPRTTRGGFLDGDIKEKKQGDEETRFEEA